METEVETEVVLAYLKTAGLDLPQPDRSVYTFEGKAMSMAWHLSEQVSIHLSATEGVGLTRHWSTGVHLPMVGSVVSVDISEDEAVRRISER